MTMRCDLTRYWDDDARSFRYGLSVWDGKALPWQAEDEQYWAQKDATLGKGKLDTGQNITPAEMKRAKHVIPAEYGVWSRTPKAEPSKIVECGCGRRLTKSDLGKRCTRCRACRAASRKQTRRRKVARKDGDGM